MLEVKITENGKDVKTAILSTEKHIRYEKKLSFFRKQYTVVCPFCFHAQTSYYYKDGGAMDCKTCGAFHDHRGYSHFSEDRKLMKKVRNEILEECSPKRQAFYMLMMIVVTSILFYGFGFMIFITLRSCRGDF